MKLLSSLLALLSSNGRIVKKLDELKWEQKRINGLLATHEYDIRTLYERVRLLTPKQ